MLKGLEDYNWGAVFQASCGEDARSGASLNYAEYVQKNKLAQKLTRTINREDVVKIIHQHDGEADVDNWWGIFKINNVLGIGEKHHLYLYVDAWCDYSGWG